MIATFHLLTTHHISCVEVTGEDDLVFADLELESLPLRVHVAKLLRCQVAHDALHLPPLDLWHVISRFLFAF
jgi:hypothetical protein